MFVCFCMDKLYPFGRFFLDLGDFFGLGVSLFFLLPSQILTAPLPHRSSLTGVTVTAQTVKSVFLSSVHHQYLVEEQEQWVELEAELALGKDLLDNKEVGLVRLFIIGLLLFFTCKIAK